MKNTVHFVQSGLGFSAIILKKSGSKEIAYISQHGSVTWKLSEKDLSKLNYDISARVQNFAAGVAHYHSVSNYTEI